MFYSQGICWKLLLQVSQLRGGRDIQWCTGVPCNAKCLYPRKLSLTPSSEDISELTYVFEHKTTSSATVYSCTAVSENSILFWKFRRANNHLKHKQNPHSSNKSWLFSFSSYLFDIQLWDFKETWEGLLLFLLLLFLLYNTEFIFLHHRLIMQNFLTK